MDACHIRSICHWTTIKHVQFHSLTLEIRCSLTAELLEDARALILADRHHFEPNLQDFLDKFTQHKKNGLLNVTAARKRLERQQATFEGIQTLSTANSKLIKQMATGRAAWCFPSTLPVKQVCPMNLFDAQKGKGGVQGRNNPA